MLGHHVRATTRVERAGSWVSVLQPISESEEESIDRFQRVVGTRLDASPLALMLDIDGTLAPIAPTPERAMVPRATREVLRRLAVLPEVIVALITGRSAEDALRMADLPGLWIIGSHGLELRTPAGELSASPEAHRYRPAVAAAAEKLGPAAAAVAGAIIEDKTWSLCLHYRLVNPGDVPELKRHAHLAADETGLRVMEGKMMVELRPPVNIDKGTAAVALSDRLGVGPDASLLCAGDDRTDEDAFRALRRRYPRVVTVRVLSDGDRGDGTTDAELTLRSTEQLRRVLELLAARREASALRA